MEKLEFREGKYLTLPYVQYFVVKELWLAPWLPISNSFHYARLPLVNMYYAYWSHERLWKGYLSFYISTNATIFLERRTQKLLLQVALLFLNYAPPNWR